MLQVMLQRVYQGSRRRDDQDRPQGKEILRHTGSINGIKVCRY